MLKYFKKIGKTEKISSSKSKGLSNEIIIPFDNTHAPELIYSGESIYVKFDGNYLKQDKVTFNQRKIVNIYIVYEITKNNPISSSYPIIQNSLFGENGVIKGSSLDIKLDLIQKKLFHIQVVVLVEMANFWSIYG